MYRWILAVVLSLLIPGVAAIGQTPEEIDGLIAQLGSDDFDLREEATSTLRTFGETARPALTEAEKSEDAEIAIRARTLLTELNKARRLDQWKADPEVCVISLHQTAGSYHDAVTTENYEKLPYAFQLFGDGRVVFRDHRFEQKTVTLTDGEVLVLLRQIEAADLLDKTHNDVFPPNATQNSNPNGVDMGVQTLEIRLGDTHTVFRISQQELGLMSNSRATELQRNIGQIFRRLNSYRHGRAKAVPANPDTE
jgi:hypothetical protein